MVGMPNARRRRFYHRLFGRSARRRHHGVAARHHTPPAFAEDAPQAVDIDACARPAPPARCRARSRSDARLAPRWWRNRRGIRFDSRLRRQWLDCGQFQGNGDPFQEPGFRGHLDLAFDTRASRLSRSGQCGQRRCRASMTKTCLWSPSSACCRICGWERGRSCVCLTIPGSCFGQSRIAAAIAKAAKAA
jgi:hypothetical protein